MTYLFKLNLCLYIIWSFVVACCIQGHPEVGDTYTFPGYLLHYFLQGVFKVVGTDVQARLPEDPQLPELDMSEPSESDPPEADPFGLDALITQDKRQASADSALKV